MRRREKYSQRKKKGRKTEKRAGKTVIMVKFNTWVNYFPSKSLKKEDRYFTLTKKL